MCTTRIHTAFAISFVLVLVLCTISFAIPVSSFNTQDLFKRSDIIAILLPVNGNGEFQIISIYKGNEQKAIGETLTITINAIKETPIEKNVEFIKYISSKKPFMAFLSNSKLADGSYKFSSDDYGWFFCDVQPQVQNNNQNGLAGVESVLISGLESNDLLIVDSSVTWLCWINSDLGIKKIVEVSQRKNPSLPVTVYSLSSNIKEGKKSNIENAITFIVELKKVTGISERMRREWRNNIVASFGYISKSDNVPYLNSLLISDDKDVASSLIFSTRNWSDYSSIPFLMIILPSLNEDTQYYCLSTLGKLTNRKVPEFPVFLQNSKKVIDEWTYWWKTEGWKIHGASHD